MIYFAFLLTNSDVVNEMAKDQEDIEDGQQFVKYALISFAVVTLLVANLALLIKVCDNQCFLTIYGLILLPTWVFVIVIGGLALHIANIANDKLQDECNKLIIKPNDKQVVDVSDASAETQAEAASSGGFSFRDYI